MDDTNYIHTNHTATILTPIHWSTDYFIIVLSVKHNCTLIVASGDS